MKLSIIQHLKKQKGSWGHFILWIREDKEQVENFFYEVYGFDQTNYEPQGKKKSLGIFYLKVTLL